MSCKAGSERGVYKTICSVGMKQIIEKSQCQNKKVYLGFIDLKKPLESDKCYEKTGKQ